MEILSGTFANNEAVALVTEDLSVTVLPNLGAKIISIVSRRTAREFVWRDPHRKVGLIAEGSLYGDNDVSGIDDCFPTIDPCRYPGDDFADISLGDHGDVWSRRWDWAVKGDEVVFQLCGESLPFVLEKSFKISTGRASLTMSYSLSVSGDVPLDYQWTGHPLFRADQCTRIEVPHGREARVGFAVGDRLAVDGSPWPWPIAPGRKNAAPGCNVSLVGSADLGVNEKYWLGATETGCVLRYEDPTEEMRVGFDPTTLPWLGICVNYGGWPDAHPGYWIAIEPSTTRYDSFAETWAAGLERRVRPGESHQWWWSLSTATPATPSKDS